MSIAVLHKYSNRGIGKSLLHQLIQEAQYTDSKFIQLETDCEKNDVVNSFYETSGFKLCETYSTLEGRKMNLYRYYFE